MEQQAIEHIRQLTAHLSRNASRLVIDADTHATDLARYPRPDSPRYFHGRSLSAEDLVEEMDYSGVSMANTWQNPAATPYTRDADRNAETLLDANRYVFLSARRYPERFIASGWTDPKACGVRNACEIATRCAREFGFALVKMNPAQNAYPIDSPEVIAVVDHIVSLGAVPVFHYGADTPFTPASGLEAIALRHPDHPVVGVHMGGGGAGYVEAETLYHESRELGLRRPNIRYILSALRDTHIEANLIAYQSAGPPFSSNLFCASDAPYGSMSWNFGGFRSMFRALRSAPSTAPLFDDGAEAAYLGGNFARFILEAYERLLKTQQVHAA